MPPVFKGIDDKGNPIGTNVTFWKAVKAGAKAPDGKPLWYKKGIQYWDGVDATDDGATSKCSSGASRGSRKRSPRVSRRRTRL